MQLNSYLLIAGCNCVALLRVAIVRHASVGKLHAIIKIRSDRADVRTYVIALPTDNNNYIAIDE